MGVVCTWLVARRMDPHQVLAAMARVPLRGLLAFFVIHLVVHFARAVRWEFLLRPIGVSVPVRRLLPLSSVGFMTILALPFRLGEFVRPYYVRRETGARMTALLGTVAVERIVDGLLISVLFFGSYIAAGGSAGAFSTPLRLAAWLSLLGFVSLTLFLVSALVWTDTTVRLCLRLSLLDRVAPDLATRLGDKIKSLIRGFRVLGDRRNLAPYLFLTAVYWIANGLSMWVLARFMQLPVSIPAAFATMAFTGVVISLPNSPGNIGQFQLGIILALRAYVRGPEYEQVIAAYAWLLWGLQAVWYLALGFSSLPFVGGGAGLRAAVAESKHEADAAEVAPSS